MSQRPMTEVTMPSALNKCVDQNSFDSCWSKNSSGVCIPSIAWSTDSSSTTLRQLSTQLHIKQQIALKTSLSIVNYSKSFKGLPPCVGQSNHFLKVYSSSLSFGTICAITVASEHRSYSKLTRIWPICGRPRSSWADEIRYWPWGLNAPNPFLIIFFVAVKRIAESFGDHSTIVCELHPRREIWSMFRL